MKEDASHGGALTLAGVTKRYGDVAAVDGLSLEVPAGSLTALLGPSGCGKSTTLALVGGLLRADAGDIVLDGISIAALSPERRPITTVFQRPLLFPHLTVAANVGFGLRMKGIRGREAARRVAEMLDRVQLTGLGDRRVGELSGGQEQRAALARALVLQPRVLLLDEPFSQLDAALRAEMRRLVLDLHAERGLTIVFVTHDQAEAVEVADTIALLLDGRLEGHATPETFYRHPPTLAAARFFGVTNEVRGEVTGGVFRAGGIQHPVDPADKHPEGPSVLAMRPESMRLLPKGSGAGSAEVTVARVTDARFAGTHTVVGVAVRDGAVGDGLRLVVHVAADEPVIVGAEVGLILPAAAPIYPGADV